jgi:hypothetical protein
MKAAPMDAELPIAEPIDADAMGAEGIDADAMDTEPANTAESAPMTGAPGDRHAQLQTEILAMVRQLYGDRSDAQLLAMDPNEIDAMDPSMFYELLGERYGVADDPTNSYFGGFGGTISHTIDFIAAHWDGTTNKTAPLPPQDWLDEVVHPETLG